MTTDPRPYDRALLLACAQRIAAEHDSTVFEPDHEEDEYSQAERDQCTDEARAVLDALATAGRLLPPDAERRERWMVKIGDGHDPAYYKTGDRRDAVAFMVVRQAARGPVALALMKQYEITTPWVEVDTKEEPTDG